MRTLTVLSALAVLLGAMLAAGTVAAKGPFRAEISGGDLREAVAIEGPLSVETVFLKDHIEAAPPESLQPEYRVTLMPHQIDGETGEDPVPIIMSYYPGNGNGPALLRGHWGTGDRYFEAGEEFRALLDGAIAGATADKDEGTDVIWYVVPGLAAVGLVLIGGLAAGRRFLVRG